MVSDIRFGCGGCAAGSEVRDGQDGRCGSGRNLKDEIETGKGQ